MKVLSKAEATLSLSHYIDGLVKEGLMVVTTHGKPVAVLVPVEEPMDLETLSVSLNPKFAEVIKRSRFRDKTEGRVGSEQVREMFEENGG
jgi:prevent-host-death family protein